MCGIGGYQLKGSDVTKGRLLLKRVTQMLTHRGPDSDGTWLSNDQQTGLAHTRLSILDLSSSGAQPMSGTGRGLTITFNGEIYNWRTLRENLQSRGCTFSSTSDTEVLLAAYSVWGVDLLEKIKGMFAFALYDSHNKTLFCARDGVGKKPFLYAESSHGFFFCSELPPLLRCAAQLELDTSLDRSALASMLLHNFRHIAEPATPYQGIHKLRPGHAMIVSHGEVKRSWCHWQLLPGPPPDSSTLLTTLEEAVQTRACADVEVGALLSGGVDSTAIVAIMQQSRTEPIKTFAFGRTGDDEDLRRARIAAHHLGTDHREYYFQPELHLQNFELLLKVYGEPIMLLPLLHAYQLSCAIRREGIKVVLNGNGADELFFGYSGHYRTARLSAVLKMLEWLPISSSLKWKSFVSLLAAPPGKRKSTYYRYLAPKTWRQVLQESGEDLHLQVCEEMERWGEFFPNEHFIDESNYISLLTENSHSVTIAGDLPGMMASVEMRSPFLDHRVIKAAISLHHGTKIEKNSGGVVFKKILREAVAGLVPETLLAAPKRGFGMEVQERDVLLGPWRQRADEIFSQFPELDLFDPAKIRTIWEAGKNGGRTDWRLMAKLFAIGMWADHLRSDIYGGISVK